MRVSDERCSRSWAKEKRYLVHAKKRSPATDVVKLRCRAVVRRKRNFDVVLTELDDAHARVRDEPHVFVNGSS